MILAEWRAALRAGDDAAAERLRVEYQLVGAVVRTPNFSAGTISQRDYRGHGAGPLDDCWVCTDLMCVHATAPWETLRGVVPYRSAAGVPDTAKGSEGGKLGDSLKAIKALWPKLGAKVELYRGTFAGLVAKAKEPRRALSASVGSKALGYNTVFDHRVAYYWNGTTWRELDPLNASYSVPKDRSEAFVRAAFAANSRAEEANALIFPTVEDAFTTHPLYQPSGAPDPVQIEAARVAGYREAQSDVAALIP